MNRKDLLISLVLALIGIISGPFLVQVQLTQMDAATKDAVLGQMGSETALIIFSSVQIGVMTAVAAFLGLKLARRTNLRLTWIPGARAWPWIGALALIAALVIALSDRLFFAPYLPAELLTYQFSLSYFIGSVLYGGIIEEVLLRLFVMSLLVFILAKLFVRGKAQLDSANPGAVSVRTIPAWIYVTAIVTAALLFAAGHLPATAQMIGLSVPIVIRSFALNGLAGLGFGYLYWKHGLGSAMAAHLLTHVLMQLVILPIAG